MGAMQCYGPVAAEPNEPLFHAEWEKRALALTVAMGATGLWNIDLSRSAREKLPPATYLAASYYEIWIRALEVLLAERGIAVPGLKVAGLNATGLPAKPLLVPDAKVMAGLLAKGSSVAREAAAPARFKTGDQVRTQLSSPQTHTRLPRYIRGKSGTIVAVPGCHVFADAQAAGLGEDPQWLYTVRFAASELFGGAAEHGHFVHVDCFEPYLASH